MMMVENFGRRENREVLGGGVASARTLRWELLDFGMELDRDLALLFLFRNGGVMVYFSGVRLGCCLKIVVKYGR